MNESVRAQQLHENAYGCRALPPSKDTDLGLGPKTCGQLLPKWPVENPPGALLGREEVGNVQHLYVRIDGGVVTVRGIRHLYRAAPHQMHTAIGISKRAAIDNLNSQRTVGPSLHVALEALIHAIDEVSARSVLGQRQTDLDVFLSIGHLRQQ